MKLPKIFAISPAGLLSISLVGGVVVGVVFRNYPNLFFSVGLDVSKFNVLGRIFIDMIKMIIGPLIFCSIASSVLSVGDGSVLTRLLTRTIAMFLVFTIVGVLLGMLVATYAGVGSGVVFDKQAVIDGFADRIPNVEGGVGSAIGIADFLLRIIPSNLIDSFLRGDFLQIIFFAAIFSVAVLRAMPASRSVSEAVVSFSVAMFSLSEMVMKFAPLAIFGILSWLVGTQSLDLIKSLGSLIATYYACTLVLMYPVYGLSLLCVGLNPVHFFKKMLPVQFLGFVTASSAATVGMAIDRAPKKLGVTPKKSNFIISLGTTINMNGGAIYFGMSAIFIANLWGVVLSPASYVTIFFLSILSAVGTAPVPGGCVLLLSGILSAVGLPVDGIAILLAVDRVLDMMVTVCNISGDSLTAVIIDKIEGELDVKRYNAP